MRSSVSHLFLLLVVMLAVGSETARLSQTSSGGRTSETSLLGTKTLVTPFSPEDEISAKADVQASDLRIFDHGKWVLHRIALTYWATSWEINHLQLIGIVAIVSFQTVLIVGLLLERRRRWRVMSRLAASEERYRNVVESQTDLICRFLPDTTLTFVNDAYCRYFGKSREELIGKKFLELIPPHARDAAMKHLQSVIDFPRTEVYEHEVILPDGSLGWQEWRNYVSFRGESMELQGIGRDITKRKMAEDALVSSEEFNRTIVESSSDCIKILDLEGNLIYMSPKGQQLLEIDEIGPYLNTSFVDLCSEEAQPLIREAISKAVKGEIGEFQAFCRTRQGNPKWWDTVISPIYGGQGTIDHLLAVSRDITEHELAVKIIEETEERFAKVFKSSPQPMSLATLVDGKFIDVNESFLNVSGYRRDELLGHFAAEIGLFETPAKREELLVQPLLNSGRVRNLEIKLKARDGTFRVLLTSAELLEFGGEKCVLLASSDITERNALEEVLRLSEREFSTLVENSPDVIARLDRDLRYIYISPNLERSTGLPIGWFIGKTPDEINLEGYDWFNFEGACREVFHTKQIVHRSFEFKGRRYSSRVIPEFGTDGSVESLMTITEDLTDRLQTEEELLQLTARLFNLQDEERRRIARELHDETAQNLFAITFNFAKLKKLYRLSGDEALQLICESQSLVEQSLKEIRTLSYLLHPPLLDEAGLVSALRWYVEGFSKRSGIYVDVFANSIDRLPSEIEMTLFRVVQEALTNVHRHSGSETATIRLERRGEEIFMEITDSGRGLSINDHPNDGTTLIATGVGIPGMRQRLRQLGGRLEISSYDQGTSILVIVPINKEVSDGANSFSRRS